MIRSIVLLLRKVVLVVVHAVASAIISIVIKSIGGNTQNINDNAKSKVVVIPNFSGHWNHINMAPQYYNLIRNTAVMLQ